MKFIDARLHGMFDYVLVAFLLIAPTVFNMGETVSLYTYVLGGVHLLLTLMTDSAYGQYPFISLKWHGILETAISMILLPIALLLGDREGVFARQFFLFLAGLYFVVSIISDYTPEEEEQPIEAYS